MTNKSKFLLGILGSLLTSGAIGIPIFITQSKKKKVDQQKLKILSKDQKQLKIITINDIKEIDNVGLQYSPNAKTKEFQLINPSWVNSVKLDKTKLSNFQKKKFDYSIKSNSLLVDDVIGTISYVAILKLNNAIREITILYENLNRISELGSFANWKKHSKGPKNILNMQFYFNSLVRETKGDLSSKDLTDLNFSGVDVSQVKKWPKDLAGTKWKGVKKLTQKNTPFQGDLSKTKLTNIIFEKVDVTWVKKWPKDLSYVNWKNVIGLTKDNTPFKGVISKMKIQGSILNGVDVSQVVNWPDDLSYIDWFAVRGLSGENTPFKGDVFNFDFNNSKLKGVDVSQVTHWPSNSDKIKNVNFSGVLISKDIQEKQPPGWDLNLWIKIRQGNGEIAEEILEVIYSDDIKKIDNVGLQYAKNAQEKKLDLINPSWVTNIEFKPEKFLDQNKRSLEYLLKPDSLKVNDKNGTITYIVIVKFSKFQKVQKEITVSYTDLTRKIDNPFRHSSGSSLKERQYKINAIAKDNDGDFSTVDISRSNLKGLDFSQIKEWPHNLTEVNWTGVKGLTESNTPFKGDISKYFIKHSTFDGIDFSKVEKWPLNLSDIKWKRAEGLEKSTPFKGDISEYNIQGLYGSYSHKLDVSKVTKWPKNLSLIKWTYIKGLTIDNTPFKGDISNKKIHRSTLTGVDVSAVTKWFNVDSKNPLNTYGVDFTGVISSWTEKPNGWHQDIWNEVKDKKDQNLSKNAVDSINQILGEIKSEQIKELDNVGLQYATNAQEKKLRLINPSWITNNNLELKISENFLETQIYSELIGLIVKKDKSLVKLIKLKIKPRSLVTDDFLGTITYIVSAKLISQEQEITIKYEGLNRKYEEDLFTDTYISNKDSKSTLWDPIKQMQYYINQETKKGSGDISGLNMENTDFAHLDVSQVTKWTNKLTGTKWANIIGLTKTNTPFKQDSLELKISNSQLAGLNLAGVTQWPNKLNKVDFTGSTNAKFSGDFSSKDITYIKLNGVDVGEITKWPENLEGVNFTGVKEFNAKSLNFRFSKSSTSSGISTWKLKNAVLKDAEMADYNKNDAYSWDKDLSGINWSGLKKLQFSSSPFKGDISEFNIKNSSFDGVEMFVNIWPKDLSGINWKGVKFKEYYPYFEEHKDNLGSKKFPGLNKKYSEWIEQHIFKNTAKFNYQAPKELTSKDFEFYKKNYKIPYLFNGDLSKYKVYGSNFEGVDVSKITKWPTNLSGINWMGVKFGQNGEGNPFKDDISTYQISGSQLKGVDVSQVDKWPTNLSGINWMAVKFGQNGEGNPFKGDISNYHISWSNLNGVDVSGVTQWPTDLSGINWKGVIGLKQNNTPFKRDLTSKKVYGSILNDVDVSLVTKWPIDLKGINWEGVKFGKNGEGNPFKGDISSYSINLNEQTAKRFTSLKGIDIRLVTVWPEKFLGINWKETQGSKNKPNAYNRNKNDVDIQSIKTILDLKDTDDLIIVLSSDTTGNIIADNKDSIEKELRKMITGDDTGAPDSPSMKGVSISVSMSTDSQITTSSAKEIIVTLRKGGRISTTISKFKVKKESTSVGIKSS